MSSSGKNASYQTATSTTEVESTPLSQFRMVKDIVDPVTINRRTLAFAVAHQVVSNIFQIRQVASSENSLVRQKSCECEFHSNFESDAYLLEEIEHDNHSNCSGDVSNNTIIKLDSAGRATIVKLEGSEILEFMRKDNQSEDDDDSSNDSIKVEQRRQATRQGK